MRNVNVPVEYLAPETNRRYPEAHELPLATKAELILKVKDALLKNSKSIRQVNGQPRAIGAVEHAILVLLARQTQDERATATTNASNGLGVRYHDAQSVVYFGTWIASGKDLSGKHLDRARKLVMNYAGTQLYELAALKAGLIQPGTEEMELAMPDEPEPMPEPEPEVVEPVL